MAGLLFGTFAPWRGVGAFRLRCRRRSAGRGMVSGNTLSCECSLYVAEPPVLVEVGQGDEYYADGCEKVVTVVGEPV